MVGFCSTSDCDYHKDNTLDVDENDDGEPADVRAEDNNDDHENNDEDYTEKQGEHFCSMKSLFWTKLGPPSWLHQKRLIWIHGKMSSPGRSTLT